MRTTDEQLVLLVPPQLHEATQEALLALGMVWSGVTGAGVRLGLPLENTALTINYFGGMPMKMTYASEHGGAVYADCQRKGYRILDLTMYTTIK